MSAKAADFTEEDRTLRFTGALTLAGLGDVPGRLEALSSPPETVDLSGVDRIDTVGAWIIHRLKRDHDVKVEGADEKAAELIEKVSAVDKPLKVRPDGTGSLSRTLAR